MIVSRWILFKMRNISDKSCREIKRKHILCWVTFFWKSCRLWENVEKYGRAREATDKNIIRRVRFACWINKATNTHSEYEILIAFPRQQLFREHSWMLHYTRTDSCYILVLLLNFLEFMCVKRIFLDVPLFLACDLCWCVLLYFGLFC